MSDVYVRDLLALLKPRTASERLKFFSRLQARLATDDALLAARGGADLRWNSTEFLLRSLVTAQVRFAEAQIRDLSAAVEDPAPVQSEPQQ